MLASHQHSRALRRARTASPGGQPAPAVGVSNGCLRAAPVGSVQPAHRRSGQFLGPYGTVRLTVIRAHGGAVYRGSSPAQEFQSDGFLRRIPDLCARTRRSRPLRRSNHCFGHARRSKSRAGKESRLQLVTKADRGGRSQDARTPSAAASPITVSWAKNTGPTNTDAEHTWILDPIDGTKAFVAGLPVFGTLVGLLERGSPDDRRHRSGDHGRTHVGSAAGSLG